MSRRALLTAGVFLAGAAFFAAGLLRGENNTVFTKAITREEIVQLPKGEKLADKLHLK